MIVLLSSCPSHRSMARDWRAACSASSRDFQVAYVALSGSGYSRTYPYIHWSPSRQRTMVSPRKRRHNGVEGPRKRARIFSRQSKSAAACVLPRPETTRPPFAHRKAVRNCREGSFSPLTRLRSNRSEILIRLPLSLLSDGLLALSVPVGPAERSARFSDRMEHRPADRRQ